MDLKHLEWDSKLFNMKCGIIEQNEADNFNSVQDVINFAKKENYKFITTKIPAQELDIVNEFLKLGAVIVDTEISFVKKRLNSTLISDTDNKFIYKKLKTYWDDSLWDILKEVKTGRFYADSRFDNNLADKMWQESTYNSFNGRADYSILCFNNEIPVGFINVFEKDKISDIFLIAVRKDYQKLGIGKNMINFYEKNIDKNINELLVETQTTNYAAQNLYISCGYKPVFAKYILHLWL